MTKRERKLTAGPGRYLAELRRSNAAGLHVKRRKNRSNARRRAIAASREG